MTGPLTNFPHDPLLDLDPWVGQRSASFRFELVNGVTGQHLGDITPLRGASLTHNTSSMIKRRLNMPLGVADTAAVNSITDRINLFMTFPNGAEYPLGTYMWAADTRQVFTSGKLAQPALTDEMLLVDQQITTSISGVGQNVAIVIQNVLTGLPIAFDMEASPFTSAEAWGIGANRGSILESLSVSGDWFSPWFGNDSKMHFIRTFDPADQIPDFNFDAGNKVMRNSIVEDDDLLTAPNIIVVVSNSANNTSEPVVGIASVPPNAPHSVFNRGFDVPQVLTLQLFDTAQAQAVAQGLVNRQSVFSRVNLVTAPDPRHDSYNVIHWQGVNWIELAWSMALVEGGTMNHLLRRTLAA
jgi:hypothetical protein